MERVWASYKRVWAGLGLDFETRFGFGVGSGLESIIPTPSHPNCITWVNLNFSKKMGKHGELATTIQVENLEFF